MFQSINNQRDRLSYLWLALGIVLLPFSMPNWTIALTAWLAPVFLLRFVRTQPLLRGMLLMLLAGALALMVGLQGVLLASGVFYYLDVFSAAVVGIVPYLLDRLLARRLGGLLSTLVFPLAVTSVWYLLGLLSPTGTIFNPAYTQYGDLPLMQLVSVTGLWGIVFLMSWLASVVNWAWEQGFAWPKVRPGLLPYGGLLALVFLGGGARLAFFAPQGATVRVAGVTALHYHTLLPSTNFGALLDEKTTQAQRQAIRPVLAQVDANMLALSQQEARAGAKVVVWPESGATVLQEDEAAFVQQARAAARASGIYLVMGLAVVLPSQQSPFGQDESVLIDPSGKVVWVYQKAHPVPGEENLRLVPGNGQIPVVATPYGRLASVVCYDTDFLDIISRTGQANVDLLLSPAGDWREIDPYHTQMSAFTAIETGSSVVKQTDGGLSMAVDYEGHVLASTDFYSTDPQVMVAYVPMQGVHTIYATIGDLFAWLGLVGLVVLIGLAVARRPKVGKAVEAAASGEPLPVS
ncbi:MAG TPA: nitrilase-related carbon-nitrogen hydrolase [Ktedonobacteraceae bacterium]|nr:nitrilase-related carbon-nitrogen hydrolase [Ktedonobacteraceae bacterium]